MTDPTDTDIRANLLEDTIAAAAAQAGVVASSYSPEDWADIQGFSKLDRAWGITAVVPVEEAPGRALIFNPTLLAANLFTVDDDTLVELAQTIGFLIQIEAGILDAQPNSHARDRAFAATMVLSDKNKGFAQKIRDLDRYKLHALDRACGDHNGGLIGDLGDPDDAGDLGNPEA